MYKTIALFLIITTIVFGNENNTSKESDKIIVLGGFNNLKGFVPAIIKKYQLKQYNIILIDKKELKSQFKYLLYIKEDNKKIDMIKTKFIFWYESTRKRVNVVTKEFYIKKIDIEELSVKKENKKDNYSSYLKKFKSSLESQN